METLSEYEPQIARRNCQEKFILVYIEFHAFVLSNKQFSRICNRTKTTQLIQKLIFPRMKISQKDFPGRIINSSQISGWHMTTFFKNFAILNSSVPRSFRPDLNSIVLFDYLRLSYILKHTSLIL